MLDCTTPQCKKALSISTLVNTSLVQLTQATDAQCEQRIVYLTDEAGLVDATDEASGDYLSQDNRRVLVNSFDQVKQHFNACTDGIMSDFYSAAEEFFRKPKGTGKRPANFYLLYWDSENETVSEALDTLKECDFCFDHIVTPITKSDGTDFEDSVEVDAWAKLNQDALNTYVVTYHALNSDSMIAGYAELTSSAYESANQDFDYSYYFWATETCIDELDATCVKTGEKINRRLPTHFMYAAAVASFSGSAGTYIPDPFYSQRSTNDNRYIANLDAQEVINYTGVSINAGGQIPEATRYANVYHKVGAYSGYLYGYSVTGFATYEIMQAKKITRELQDKALSWLNKSIDRGITENNLVSLENEIALLALGYVGQGIITTDPQDFENNVPEGYNVINSGDGWVLARRPISSLTQAQLSQGFVPEYFFCYVGSRQARFINITICSLLSAAQLSEVI